MRFSYCADGGGTADAEATRPPLVLLHGIGSNARSWTEQLAGLGELRRVVAWDAPGYGDSTAVAPPRPARRRTTRIASPGSSTGSGSIASFSSDTRSERSSPAPSPPHGRIGWSV